MYLTWEHRHTGPSSPSYTAISFRSVELLLHHNEMVCIWITEAMHMNHCVTRSTRAYGINYSFWTRGPYVVSGARATGLQALLHKFLFYVFRPSTSPLSARYTSSGHEPLRHYCEFKKHQRTSGYEDSACRNFLSTSDGLFLTFV